jgi:hypothetical protein
MTQEQKNEIKVGAMIIAKWDNVWREYGYISSLNLELPKGEATVTWLTVAPNEYAPLVSHVNLKDYGIYWKVIT